MRAASNQERVIMARVRYLNRLYEVQNKAVAPGKARSIPLTHMLL